MAKKRELPNISAVEEEDLREAGHLIRTARTIIKRSLSEIKSVVGALRQVTAAAEKALAVTKGAKSGIGIRSAQEATARTTKALVGATKTCGLAVRRLGDAAKDIGPAGRAPSRRKFFRQVFEIEVLSEDEALSSDLSLEDIAYEITDGHCSGVLRLAGTEKLSSSEMAEALMRQGSDPGFFRLDEKGKSVEEG